MLKTLEYVDPLLSQKIVNLQQQLLKVEQSKLQIINNESLSPSTKTKLLRYQLECQNNIRKLLEDQKDKLGDYLDQQTHVLTKQNRENHYNHNHKNSFVSNQSTRIDISLDDSKSLQITRQSQHFKKSMNSISQKKANNPSNNRTGVHPNRYKAKLNRLNKKVAKQQTLINVLVSWLKIYYQREQNANNINVQGIQRQNKQIMNSNRILISRCKDLQTQLAQIKSDFKNSSLIILESHQKCEKLRLENKQLELQRKKIIQDVRSLEKRK